MSDWFGFPARAAAVGICAYAVVKADSTANRSLKEAGIVRNIIDYVEQEMNSIEDKAFNPVDSLVLSQFSYLHFEG